MITAASHPGQNTSSSRSGRRSASVRDTIAKIAMVAPCSTAVPSPRTSQSSKGASVSVPRYSMFSTTAKPAPTAKPCTAASTRNPTRRRATRNTMNPALRVSSVIGATYRLNVLTSRPVAGRSHACSAPQASAATAPAAIADSTALIRTSLKLSINCRPPRKSNPGTSARATERASVIGSREGGTRWMEERLQHLQRHHRAAARRPILLQGHRGASREGELQDGEHRETEIELAPGVRGDPPDGGRIEVRGDAGYEHGGPQP